MQLTMCVQVCVCARGTLPLTNIHLSISYLWSVGTGTQLEQSTASGLTLRLARGPSCMKSTFLNRMERHLAGELLPRKALREQARSPATPLG
jgi:hypothetical protein